MSPSAGVLFISLQLLIAVSAGHHNWDAADSDFLQPVSYENFTLYRVWANPHGSPIEDDFHGGLVLSMPDARTASYDILLPPETNTDFLTDLKNRKWSFKVLNKNVQELIDQEEVRNTMNFRAGEPYIWDRYLSYEESNTWMKDLAEQHPNDVTLIDIGMSYQNRRTYGLKLSRGSVVNKSAVFIEAGVHSREWIAPVTSLWIFNHLLTSEDPAVQKLSSDYDWFVVPLVNPDGYVHTRINRMWRKNMRRNRLCMGTDVNRNWNYHWREAGSSSYACSDSYAGAQAMSEPETRNLDNFMKTIQHQVKLYISFHAYSQLLLWPEGHTRQRIPEFDHYEQIGKATVDAIAQRYGTEYERGSIIETIYAASGSTIDYMRANYKIPLTFCFELRPSRAEGGGGMGFILEPDQIVPTGEETFDGIAAMIGESRQLGYM